MATILGVLDDTLQLRARWQLLGQVVLALGAVAAGIVVTSLNNPFGPRNIILDEPYAAGFTIVWIVGMINSINFIDGLDGLSSGIALIAAATLGLISLTATIEQPFIASCASASPARCSGSCAGTSTRRRSSSARAA